MKNKYKFKSIHKLEKIDKERLKQTLISLSVLEDMAIPQRSLEIKNFLRKKEWLNEEFREEIKHGVNEIISNKDIKIKLKHINFIKNFPSQPDEKFNVMQDVRTYHQFKDIKFQIAIAYILTNINLLNDVSNLFSSKTNNFHKEFNLNKNSKNYGNISYSSKNEKVNNDKQVKNPEFFRFYFKWQKQWSKFINSFDILQGFENKNIIVWKIDFKNSYNNLNPKKFFTKNGYSKEYQNRQIMDLFYISQLYYCEECKENKMNVNEIVPYGGTVESHIIANMLILEKMKAVIRVINQARGYKVLGYTGYVDDIAIFIEILDKNKNENWKNRHNDELKINQIKKEFCNKNNLLRKFQINENEKMKVFSLVNEINNKKRIKVISQIKETYSSVSMFKSLITPNFLSENIFSIKYFTSKFNPSDSRTNANYEKIKFIEKLSRFNFLTHKKIVESIEENKSKKDFEFYFTLIYKKLSTNKQKRIFFKSVLYNFNCLKKFLKKSDDLQTFNKYWKNNVENILIKSKLLDDIKIYKEFFKRHKKYPTWKESAFYGYAHRIDENPIYEIIDYIEDPNKILVELIDKTSRLNIIEDDFKKINNIYLFGKKASSIDSYWKLLKTSLFIYFNELFGNKINFLYFRFKLFLHSSDNRVEFIKWMKYIKQDLYQIADINFKIIYDIDKEYLTKIKFTYLSYTPKKEQDDKLIDIDTLFKVRILSKMLWENGSFSTHSYTTHNEKHGDKLLLRFTELRRAIKEFRQLINKDNISIFALIASFYTHDLGMLINGIVSNKWNDSLKDIYNKISKNIRKIHGTNSSSIMKKWLGSYLKISNKEIAIMSSAAIAHEKGINSLQKTSSKKTIITSLLLCILDLLDITSDRSQIISRKISGTIASEESKAHWIKHYFTHKITEYEIDYDNNIFKITVEVKNIEIRNIGAKFSKTNTILNAMHVENKDLAKLVEKDLKRWLEKNINDFFNYLNFKKEKDIFKINVLIKPVEHIPYHLELDFFRDENNPKTIGEKIGKEIKKIINS